MPLSDWCLCGLGNPGEKYAQHRHNLGAQFVELFVTSHHQKMTFNKKIGGRYAKISLGSLNVHAFIPESYMNLSGIPVAQMVRFFNLTASQLIVVHDELDIPAGYLRIKKGGGTGGHNGLKDIDKHLGTKEYYRLRLGIGRPQDAREVSSFVLKAPTLQESDAIAALFHELLKYQDWMWEGSWDKMQNHFHGLDKNL